MVDYPNSKKARKVFLVLFVGGGGGKQQVPEGLEGEEREDGKARFERRREREGKRDKSGKRKSVKDKDWILKKKQVSMVLPGSDLVSWRLHFIFFVRSCIDSAEKRVYPEIQSSQVGKEKQFFSSVYFCYVYHLSALPYY